MICIPSGREQPPRPRAGSPRTRHGQQRAMDARERPQRLLRLLVFQAPLLTHVARLVPATRAGRLSIGRAAPTCCHNANSPAPPRRGRLRAQLTRPRFLCS